MQLRFGALTMRLQLQLTLLLATACEFGLMARADSPLAAETNWPSWRGPLATGEAPDAHPPTEWSEQKNIRWKVKIPGSGTASPVIWGDQVFIATAIPTGKKPAEEADTANKPDDANKATKPDGPANDKAEEAKPPEGERSGDVPPGEGAPGERRRRRGGGGRGMGDKSRRMSIALS